MPITSEYRKNPEYYSNWSKRKYRTPAGRLSSMYVGMQSRVRGQSSKAWNRIYEGLPIVTRQEFLEWATREGTNYWNLFQAWEASGYQHNLTPSIDRTDPLKGYTLSNMALMTWQENTNKKRKRNKLSIEQIAEIRGRYIKPTGKGKWSPNSIPSLSKEFGVSKSTIWNIVNNLVMPEVAPKKLGV